MVYELQLLLYDNCDFPLQYPIYFDVHVIIFFILFGQFYVQEYFNKKQKATSRKSDTNGRTKLN